MIFLSFIDNYTERIYMYSGEALSVMHVLHGRVGEDDLR